MADGQLEQVYDEEISPLMTQVIAICKRVGIPVYASFRLDDDLSCTTYIAPPRLYFVHRLMEAVAIGGAPALRTFLAAAKEFPDA